MPVRLLMAGLLLVSLLVACGAEPTTQTSSTAAVPAAVTPSAIDAITGDGELLVRVTYRERIALLPGTTVVVELQDVSKADAPAVILASETLVTTDQQVPIPFKLRYTADDILPDHTYVVMARIVEQGKLLFITTESMPVLTNGAPMASIEVTLTKIQ